MKKLSLNSGNSRKGDIRDNRIVVTYVFPHLCKIVPKYYSNDLLPCYYQFKSFNVYFCMLHGKHRQFPQSGMFLSLNETLKKGKKIERIALLL